MAIFGKDPAPSRSESSRSDAGVERSTVSVLGPDLVFDGVLSGQENTLVEGELKGRVDLASDLRIAASARVTATVHARTVIVEGTVEGDVSAESRLELRESARVKGNLRAPRVLIAEGARFQGQVDMNATAPPRQEKKAEEERNDVGRSK